MFADEAVQIGLPLVSVVRRRHLRNLDAILVEDFKPAVIGDTLFVFSGRAQAIPARSFVILPRVVQAVAPLPDYLFGTYPS